jgi:hypothetical protein
VARGDTIFGGHPFGFEQGILGQAHENGIEGARFQSCFAAQFVAVAPSGGAVEEALEKEEGLRRKAGRFHELKSTYIENFVKLALRTVAQPA